MTPFLADRRVLYFVFGRGCGACEAAEPELDRFVLAHPNLMAIRLDAAGPHPERLGLQIRATPTYVLRIGSRGISHEGAMTAEELAVWMQGAEEDLAGEAA